MAGTLVIDAVKSSTSGPPAFQNTSGTEVGQLCRAWVNFSGVTTASIRASFNVSSVTRNGTGNYTINFSNALPDSNYSTLLSHGVSTNSPSVVPIGFVSEATAPSASNITVITMAGSTPAATDRSTISVGVFR